MVVETAGPERVEIAGLPALAGRQESDLVELRTIHVVGMRVRGHLVIGRVVVDERGPGCRP